MLLQLCDTFAQVGQSSCSCATRLPGLGKAPAVVQHVCPGWAKPLQLCDTFAQVGQSSLQLCGRVIGDYEKALKGWLGEK